MQDKVRVEFLINSNDSTMFDTIEAPTAGLALQVCENRYPVLRVTIRNIEHIPQVDVS